MKPRDLEARLAWACKRLRQRQRKPLARHAGEAMSKATDKTQTRPVAPCAPCGAADDPSKSV